MAERIQKRLAQLGFGSRREIESWIEEGRITLNGEIAKLGQTVENSDQLLLDGKKIDLSEDKTPSKHVILYNKLEGEVCTRSDPQGRPTVFDKLPPVHNGRWVSVGRLDVNTSGLLLFTTDGELANRLMHPSHHIDREYAVRVLGNVDETILNRLVNGVELDDGPARFEEIVLVEHDQEREGANQWFYVCLQEGRNREVRRIWESQPGLKVSRLKRVRYANIFLPKTLRKGQWKLAEQEELNDLYALVDLKAPKLKSEKSATASRKAKHERKSSPSAQRREQRKSQDQQRRRRNSANSRRRKP